MAYEKQVWDDGDIITKERMNHMEDGIAGDDPIVIYRGANGVGYKDEEKTVRFSYAEAKNIIEALDNGKSVYVKANDKRYRPVIWNARETEMIQLYDCFVFIGDSENYNLYDTELYYQVIAPEL